MMGDVLSGDAGLVFLLLYLLPGFLGATAYRYLVEGERGDNFDRVVNALVLTLVSTLIVHGVPLFPDLTVDKNTPVTTILRALLTTDILYASIVSVIIAIIFAIFHNQGWLYDLARTIRITYKVSNTDVWQDTFYKHKGYWICVRFSDGSSLIGWPKYYSPVGKPRELFIADATWWYPNINGNPASRDVVGAGVYISDFSNVVGIELLE